MSRLLNAVALLASEEGKIQAHHPLFPELKELTWGGSAFAVVLGMVIWKGHPIAKKALNDRTQKIADAINAAEAMRSAAEAAVADLQTKLGNAESEAARIIAEAHTQSGALKTQLHEQSVAEIAEYRTRTASELAAAKDRVIADLNAEITALTVSLAEKVVRRTLDASTQNALVDDAIVAMGATR